MLSVIYTAPPHMENFIASAHFAAIDRLKHVKSNTNFGTFDKLLPLIKKPFNVFNQLALHLIE